MYTSYSYINTLFKANVQTFGLSTSFSHSLPDSEEATVFYGYATARIDAIGTKRFDSQTGADREVQRILLELLNQMDAGQRNHEKTIGKP